MDALSLGTDQAKAAVIAVGACIAYPIDAGEVATRTLGAGFALALALAARFEAGGVQREGAGVVDKDVGAGIGTEGHEAAVDEEAIADAGGLGVDARERQGRGAVAGRVDEGHGVAIDHGAGGSLRNGQRTGQAHLVDDAGGDGAEDDVEAGVVAQRKWQTAGQDREVLVFLRRRL